MRTKREGSAEVFLPSQLVELSRRFQSDVEDLQVLLQEEGLPVRSADCLQQLSTRLRSDPRFRRDVAFLVRSMLGRERDEPGSMDVLGVLVIAAAGTPREFDNPTQQQFLRELLRFVIQQRRSAADPAIPPDSAELEHLAAKPTTSSRHIAIGSQQPSPGPLPEMPNAMALPSRIRAEPETFSRRVHAPWIAVAMALLLVLGAGLLMSRASSKATTPELAPSAHALPPASPRFPAGPEPENRAFAPSSVSSSNSRRSSPSLRRAGPRHAEPAGASMPMTVGASIAPKTVGRTEPTQNGPGLNQPVISSTGPPSRPRQESAPVSLPAEVPRQRGIPDSTGLSSVFAHPGAPATAGQVAPPVFRPHDPVLIARNTPIGAFSNPNLQATVHIGSTGTMASSLMYSPEPEYPARAIAAGIQGQVTVRAIVGLQGNVIDASVVSGPPLLREPALEAVGRWRYRPYEQDGKAVTMATTAILDFQLPPKNDGR